MLRCCASPERPGTAASSRVWNIVPCFHAWVLYYKISKTIAANYWNLKQIMLEGYILFVILPTANNKLSFVGARNEKWEMMRRGHLLLHAIITANRISICKI